MEESSNNLGSLKNKPRSKKLNPKIDLTAMISVSFLLIIFFMVTKELSKPKALNLGMSENFGCGATIYCGYANYYRTITLLLDDRNKIISYHGLIYSPYEKAKVLNYGKDGIRKELIKKDKIIKEYLGDYKKGIIVIIKPSKKSNYGNLIDILDEMAISDVNTYSIVNYFTPEEIELLALN